MANVSDEVVAQFAEALQGNPDVPDALIGGLVAELTVGGGNSDRLAELIKSAAEDNE